MAAGHNDKNLYIVDAHGLIFQLFHAVGQMSSPSGVPTNALYGFTRDILSLRNERRPDYLLCAFDVAAPTFREKIAPDYKANRKPPDSDLQLQIPLIVQMLQAMRIPTLGVEGFEADDVIATVAVAAAKKGINVFICSSDKDLRQLVSDRIKIFDLRKQRIFDSAALKDDWGITPEQVIDYQSLVGDSVDNVKGVEGIGAKTAAKLLQDYGTIENLLANVDKISGDKRRENLRAAGPILERNRKLVRLATDVPLTLDWEGWRLRDWDAPRLFPLFREWGFRRYADQVRDSIPPPPPPKAEEQGPKEVQGELFPAEEGSDPAPAPARAPRPSDGWKGNYRLVDTPEKFQGFLAELKKQSRFAVDLETTDLDPRRAEIVGYAFCWKEGEAHYLPVRGPKGDATLDPKKVIARLRPVLEEPGVAKVNQNIKYDWMVLRRHGINLAGVVGDPMLADYLLHAGDRNHNMEVLARDYLHHQVIPITDLIGKKGKGQKRMDEVATAQVAEYAGEDADVALRLCDLLEPRLQPEGLRPLYDDLEVPLIEVLAELESNGIRLDVPFLKRLGQDMDRQMQGLEKEIYQHAGHEFNVASLKQLRQVLFDELKLPVRRRTGIKNEPSTDQETLEELADLHPLPRKLVEHRKIAKLKGTYVEALPELVSPQTGRLHTEFNQTITTTGRLSSSNPNLQNIPIRSEQGGQIRQAFLPEAGWMLLTADYSQVELRLLAHFAGDEALRTAFAEDRDIHASVAAQIFGVAEKDITSEMRRLAKTVNFGVIYGISSVGLARRLDISKEEGAKFIDAYFARYPKVLEYQARLLETARKEGYVRTLLGRRRPFDPSVIRPDSTYQQRNQAEREAINMEIQGSAADLMKVAMLNVYRRLNSEKWQTRMLLQIHDELVFEAPPDELPSVAPMIAHEMTSALASRLQIPLKVDLAAGPNWLEVKEVEVTSAAR
ncbi:MAG: DNA polymerase I [Gemmataceae bacterium]|nr:DNA polymerase I [Gemmataceae bacterium]